MQKRTKAVIAGASGVAVLIGVVVGVQLLDDDEGSSAALEMLPAGATSVEFVDREAVFEASGHGDLEHGASESEFQGLQDIPAGTPLMRYVTVMQEAAFSELSVDWYASAMTEDGSVAVYRLDDDVDLGDVAEDMVDAGYDESEVDGHTRLTVELGNTSDGLAGGHYPFELHDVTLVEDEHLLVAGTAPEVVLDVLEGEADSAADDEDLTALFDEAGDVAYASVSLGDSVHCGGAGGDRLTESQLQVVLEQSGMEDLGTPRASGLFLADDDDLTPVTVLGFGSDAEAEEDAEARKAWLEDESDPQMRVPNSGLYDVETVESDGSVVRIDVGYDGGAMRAVSMTMRGGGPGACGA